MKTFKEYIADKKEPDKKSSETPIKNKDDDDEYKIVGGIKIKKIRGKFL